MVQIQLTSLLELDRFQNKIKQVRMQFDSFQQTRIQELSEEIVLHKIHERMGDAGFSEKIIEGTKIKDVVVNRDSFTIFVISELFSETGFDIALAREKGTVDHFIEPRAKKALRWVQEGVVLFSKGHEVSGLPALMIIANTLDELESQVLGQFNLELQNWLDMNLGTF